ncbi:hypothetical protein HYH03_005344 [Edaphochlamys debaryana]|uniref:Cyclic nucleotide-binding domain-containing protein n=1 Tax=Edaphochlamys debaryana TaxID=47281 RepID=A0A835YCV9_9CHLO|nr:hypothetical protein HYH03_005344 [Edaphochlamys debaryana]|eukprot:KAG2496520.1 hypothetical protein HYH03_005344 [Edaphochlamys debaryana]
MAPERDLAVYLGYLNPIPLLDKYLPILNPTRWPFALWSLFMLCMVSLACIIGFRDVDTLRTFYVIDWVTTAAFMADVVVQFRCGFITSQGEVERDSGAIARHYLRGMFAIDFLSALPYQIILAGISQENQRHLVWLGLLKLPRLVRLARALSSAGRGGYAASLVSMARLLLAMLLLVHGSVCIWHYFYENLSHWPWIFSSCTQCTTVGTEYLFGFYSAFLLMLGDKPEANNNVERVFVIVLLFVGALFYAVVIGSLTLLVADMFATASRHKSRAAMVDDSLKYRGVPDDVREKVGAYFDHLSFYQHPGPDGVAFLNELPPGLYATVMSALFGAKLSRVQLFAYTEPPFIRRLAEKLRLSLYMAGDVLYEYGSVGHEMYVIWKGAIALVQPDGGMSALLCDGDHFGELGLMTANTPRGHRAVALRPCDVVLLSRWELLEAMKDFPESAALVKDRARSRLEDHEAPASNLWVAVTAPYGSTGAYGSGAYGERLEVEHSGGSSGHGDPLDLTTRHDCGPRRKQTAADGAESEASGASGIVYASSTSDDSDKGEAGSGKRKSISRRSGPVAEAREEPRSGLGSGAGGGGGTGGGGGGSRSISARLTTWFRRGRLSPEPTQQRSSCDWDGSPRPATALPATGLGGSPRAAAAAAPSPPSSGEAWALALGLPSPGPHSPRSHTAALRIQPRPSGPSLLPLLQPPELPLAGAPSVSAHGPPPMPSTRPDASLRTQALGSPVRRGLSFISRRSSGQMDEHHREEHGVGDIDPFADMVLKVTRSPASSRAMSRGPTGSGIRTSGNGMTAAQRQYLRQGSVTAAGGDGPGLEPGPAQRTAPLPPPPLPRPGAAKAGLWIDSLHDGLGTPTPLSGVCDDENDDEDELIAASNARAGLSSGPSSRNRSRVVSSQGSRRAPRGALSRRASSALDVEGPPIPIVPPFPGLPQGALGRASPEPGCAPTVIATITPTGPPRARVPPRRTRNTSAEDLMMLMDGDDLTSSQQMLQLILQAAATPAQQGQQQAQQGGMLGAARSTRVSAQGMTTASQRRSATGMCGTPVGAAGGGGGPGILTATDSNSAFWNTNTSGVESVAAPSCSAARTGRNSGGGGDGLQPARPPRQRTSATGLVGPPSRGPTTSTAAAVAAFGGSLLVLPPASPGPGGAATAGGAGAGASGAYARRNSTECLSPLPAPARPNRRLPRRTASMLVPRDAGSRRSTAAGASAAGLALASGTTVAYSSDEEAEQDDDWSDGSGDGRRWRDKCATLKRKLAEAQAALTAAIDDPLKVPAIAAVFRREFAALAARLEARVEAALGGVLGRVSELSVRAEDAFVQAAAADDRLQRLEELAAGLLLDSPHAAAGDSVLGLQLVTGDPTAGQHVPKNGSGGGSGNRGGGSLSGTGGHVSLDTSAHMALRTVYGRSGSATTTTMRHSNSRRSSTLIPGGVPPPASGGILKHATSTSGSAGPTSLTGAGPGAAVGGPSAAGGGLVVPANRRASVLLFDGGGVEGASYDLSTARRAAARRGGSVIQGPRTSMDEQAGAQYGGVTSRISASGGGALLGGVMRTAQARRAPLDSAPQSPSHSALHSPAGTQDGGGSGDEAAAPRPVWQAAASGCVGQTPTHAPTPLALEPASPALSFLESVLCNDGGGGGGSPRSAAPFDRSASLSSRVRAPAGTAAMPPPGAPARDETATGGPSSNTRQLHRLASRSTSRPTSAAAHATEAAAGLEPAAVRDVLDAGLGTWATPAHQAQAAGLGQQGPGRPGGLHAAGRPVWTMGGGSADASQARQP